jgi:hypothetical protein
MPKKKMREKHEMKVTECKKEDGWKWIGFIWLRKGQIAGSSKYGTETSGSIRFREFLH